MSDRLNSHNRRLNRRVMLRFEAALGSNVFMRLSNLNDDLENSNTVTYWHYFTLFSHNRKINKPTRLSFLHVYKLIKQASGTHVQFIGYWRFNNRTHKKVEYAYLPSFCTTVLLRLTVAQLTRNQQTMEQLLRFSCNSHEISFQRSYTCEFQYRAHSTFTINPFTYQLK